MDIKELWEWYKKFCKEAVLTTDIKSGSATDFLGWLEEKLKDSN